VNGSFTWVSPDLTFVGLFQFVLGVVVKIKNS